MFRDSGGHGSCFPPVAFSGCSLMLALPPGLGRYQGVPLAAGAEGVEKNKVATTQDAGIVHSGDYGGLSVPVLQLK